MNFLQPWMLWAIPAIALPIAIHLIHKRRQRVVEWGAMMFLLAGAKMSKGWQKIRQFLLLALRTIAVAALIFGLGRPIAGGWLGGLGGGRPDTVLVLLDRSASMAQEISPGVSKLEEGTRRIVEALDNIEASRLCCIDSISLAVTPLEDPKDLIGLPLAQVSDAHSDVPAMFEAAASYLQANDSGRAEIWVCSDGQSADWRTDDGRWLAVQDALLGLGAGARVNLLHFDGRNEANLSVRVESAEVLLDDEQAELALSFRVRAEDAERDFGPVPVTIHLGGARSVIQVEISGGEAVLGGHRVPLGEAEIPGWGYIELPPDGQAADNRYYFTYGTERVQETVIVAEDDGVAEVLQIAAEAPLSRSMKFLAERIPVGGLGVLDLTPTALLLWQAPLPQGELAVEVESFLAAGGRVLFFPPADSSEATFLGCGFGAKKALSETDGSAVPSSWRREGDLLRDGEDGTPLSLPRLEVSQLTEIRGDLTPLARMGEAGALLARAPTSRGGLYFVGTSPSVAESNLSAEGLVLVALVQRALAASAEDIGSRTQQIAGAVEGVFGEPERLSEARDEWLLSDALIHAGVLQSGDAVFALNRSLDEDRSKALAEERLSEIMPDVDFSLVSAGVTESNLVDEVWRVFLIAMLVGLIGEALLCITESNPREVAA